MFNWLKQKIKKFWKWIVALTVGAVTVANFVGFPPPETPNLYYVDVFEEVATGNKMRIASDKVSYEKLGFKDAKPLTPPNGYKWLYSFSTTKQLTAPIVIETPFNKPASSSQ